MDKAWKAWERRVAKMFGGVRRGADTRDDDVGKSDIILPGWAIEVKLRKVVTYGMIVDAVRQAEENSKDGQKPIAVIKKFREKDTDALVVIRLEKFLEYFVENKGD